LKFRIYYDNINFRLKESSKIKELIKKVIKIEKKTFDDLIFVFTSDKELVKINKEFLGRIYYTDVISFNYSDKTEKKAEVYISIDTVRYNANNYKVSLKEEVLRVMIHGTLHLCGYKDNTKESRRIMKMMEEIWLKKYIKK